MARKQINDFILNNKYTIFDATNSGGSVLSSLLGCSNIDLPTISVENKQIKEGNKGSKRSVYKSHDYSNLVIQRGTSLLTSDFYDWIDSHIKGIILPKKLIVVVYTNIDGGKIGGYASMAGEVMLSSGGINSFKDGGIRGGLGKVFGAAGAKATKEIGKTLLGDKLGIGVKNDFKNYIPAKSWIVEGCVPAVYGPGTLTGSGADVLIQNFEIEVEDMKEIGTNISL